MLDNESSATTDLERLGNCSRRARPRAVGSGRLYIGFRGILNPVVASIRHLTYIY